MTLEFWFEFASTYSYPAAMRIERLAAEQGVAVAWKPFLLGPIFREQGWNDSPFNLYPAKGRYMWRDLERVCASDGIAFRRPSHFPRNGLLAARLACAFCDAPWAGEFTRAVYRANFADDLDIADPAVISRCLGCSGEDPRALLEAAQSDTAKAKLREQTEHASRLGIFGAPTVCVGGELFWGNDRLEDAVAWAVEHSETRGTPADAQRREILAPVVSDAVIRRSTDRDAESFRHCLDIVARERRYLAFLEAPPLAEVRAFMATRGLIQYVAAVDGEIVGWCDVNPRPWDGFRHCGALGMGIVPSHRHRGLGRALLCETLAAAEAAGLTRIELEVLASNQLAIALYERNGFAHEGRKRRARILAGLADDVLCMARLAPGSGGHRT